MVFDELERLFSHWSAAGDISQQQLAVPQRQIAVARRESEYVTHALECIEAWVLRLFLVGDIGRFERDAALGIISAALAGVPCPVSREASLLHADELARGEGVDGIDRVVS